jgi:hypothetical protein
MRFLKGKISERIQQRPPDRTQLRNNPMTYGVMLLALCALLLLALDSALRIANSAWKDISFQMFYIPQSEF